MHAGSKLNQMASCFTDVAGDSLADDNYFVDGKVGGIFRALTDLAVQSKGGAGTCISIQDIRSKGSKVKKSNGKSNGIIPFMKMFDSVIAGIDQSGKRAGVCTLSIEVWHADILEFLEVGRHGATEEIRCKNLFLALMCNDIFFERLYDAISTQKSVMWTLVNPAVTKEELGYNLSDVYGEDFRRDYTRLESAGLGQAIDVLSLWSKVCEIIRQNGFPYILNKDTMNAKSNQQNLGTIKGSNICCEIALYHNEATETGVCVLSSVCLGRFVNTDKSIDYEGIIHTARLATRNLNSVSDIQFYPNSKTRNYCLMRRALGIGAQGLADLFAQLGYNFDSPEAKELNKKVYECIYYGCMLESMEISKLEGPYTGYEGSPVSKGILQYDMWGLSEKDLFLGDRWLELKKDIAKYGIRNSELTALAPTASSSTRMSNNEMHEPFSRNIYVKSTICGEVRIINPYLVADLGKHWSQYLANQIILNRGSVQGISEIPAEIQAKYKNAYELDSKDLIDMMADRSPFVSQTASFNHFVYTDASLLQEFTRRVLYAWKKRLKTLSYYCHTGSKTTGSSDLAMNQETAPVANTEKEEDCEFCST
jgi:ribonucleoside-diphosphate reductase alpha subunit